LFLVDLHASITVVVVETATKRAWSKGMAMTRLVAAATILLLIPLSHGGVTGQTSAENTCTLYLAESSMKNVNGNGIFTVKHFKKGETILERDAPTIPVLNPWPEDPVLDH
jgi:hypothetical protein